MGCKAVETTCNINNAFGPRTANEHTVQWWFKEFCKGDESLEDKPRTGYFKTTDVSSHSSGGQKSEIKAVSTGPSPSEICSRESFLARKLLLFAGNTWDALCVCISHSVVSSSL